MILTHGANSLPRGNTLKLLYSLDINAFDVNTLKDGDVQWSVLNGRRAPTLSKNNGKLIIDFTQGSKQEFRLLPSEFLNYDDSKDYVIEFEVDYIQFGTGGVSLAFGAWPYLGDLSWFGYVGNRLDGYGGAVDNLASGLQIVSEYGSSKIVIQRTKEMPWRTKYKIYHNQGHKYIEVSWNDVMAFRVRNDNPLSALFFVSTDINGSSANQRFVLSSFAVTQL